MNLEELREEVDEELREEEREEIKANMKDKKRRDYYKMNMRQKLWQEFRCLVGKHMFNHIPSMNMTTCPACTRMWNGLGKTNSPPPGWGKKAGGPKGDA